MLFQRLNSTGFSSGFFHSVQAIAICWLTADKLPLPMSTFVSWLHLRVILDGAHCVKSMAGVRIIGGEVQPGQCRPAVVGAHPSLLNLLPSLFRCKPGSAHREIDGGVLVVVGEVLPRGRGPVVVGVPWVATSMRVFRAEEAFLPNCDLHTRAAPESQTACIFTS